ncbi:MAG: Hint domain-containing homing endonuclease [Candidatus Colwellbacteria bacterium]|nr:Hint domain-containing homing endonuclease [Candidatus Colwellbacteria bacterium]
MSFMDYDDDCDGCSLGGLDGVLNSDKKSAEAAAALVLSIKKLATAITNVSSSDVKDKYTNECTELMSSLLIKMKSETEGVNIKEDYSKKFKFDAKFFSEGIKPFDVVIIYDKEIQDIIITELKISTFKYGGLGRDMQIYVHDLYNLLPRMKEYKPEKEEIVHVWTELVGQLEKKCESLKKDILKKIGKDTIEFEDLWYLFPVNTDIVYGQYDKKMGMKITSIQYVASTQVYYHITGYNISLGHKGNFVKTPTAQVIYTYKGTKSVNEFDIHVISPDEKESFTKRAEKALAIFKDKKSHYVHYNGNYQYNNGYDWVKINIDSRVMIDYKQYHTTLGRYKKTDTMSGVKSTDLYLFYPFVFGYDLHQYQRWGIYDVEHVKEIEYYKNAFDKLILPGDDGETKKETIIALLENFAYSSPDIVQNKNSGLIALLGGPPGTGKCLAKNTPILMFDGTVKMVQDIKTDEKIMGDDSSERNILSTTTGNENLYKITTIRGDTYTVNESHILSLKYSGTKIPVWFSEKYQKKDGVIDIHLKEYLSLPSSIKDKLKTYRVGISFDEMKVEIDPYIIGHWLGDGSSRDTVFSTNDKEIVEYYEQEMKKYNLSVVKISGDNYDYRVTTGINTFEPRSNHFRNVLKDNNMMSNKHIPFRYKCNSRENQLKLLAGIIDSDGSYTNNCYDIVQKNKTLLDDIIFVARSLGFYCKDSKEVTKICYNSKNGPVEGTYYRTHISGEGLEEIPCLLEYKRAHARCQIKNALVDGFSVECLGEGDYYGFSIDGNRRFVLGNFIVTHNTMTAQVAGEHLKRPVYYVSTGSLGLETGNIEASFKKIVTLAQRWNAIVLLDEADVFLEARDKTDIKRNAIVGSFLTVLEYFNGILFMTTNRIAEFDPAVMSRIHMTLHFPPMKEISREKIWRAMVKESELVDKNTPDLGCAIVKYKNLNGRQLRTIFNVASTLARKDKTTITDRHVIMACGLNSSD